MWLLDCVFSPVSTLLLLGAGVWFSVTVWRRIGAGAGRAARLLTRGSGGVGCSPLRSLCLALAGTVGVGNIAGVALALESGGAGAVFWMWVSGALVMAVKYAEIAAAMLTREPDGEGGWRGGAMYTIRRALPGGIGRGIAAVFALLCLADSLAVGSAVQANAVAGALSGLGIPTAVSGALLILGCLPVLRGRGMRVASLTQALVPFMGILYLGMAIYALIVRREALPAALAAIFREAFSLRAAAGGGALGWLAAGGLRAGVGCGLFSNEAGCGTSPMAHIASRGTPAGQGLCGMIEVFVDTGVICTATALVLLTSGTQPGGGILWTVEAFRGCLGNFAAVFVAGAVLLFAYATIVCWYYYGRQCLRFFTASAKAGTVFAVIFCVAVGAGAVLLPNAVWDIANLLIAAMTCLNLLCLFPMSRDILRQTDAELGKKRGDT